MRLSVKYIINEKGETKAVQIPIAQWKKISLALIKREQELKLKSDLEEAFDDVVRLQTTKVKKSNLSHFLKNL